jgi:hypothetical protein
MLVDVVVVMQGATNWLLQLWHVLVPCSGNKQLKPLGSSLTRASPKVPNTTAKPQQMTVYMW